MIIVTLCNFYDNRSESFYGSLTTYDLQIGHGHVLVVEIYMSDRVALPLGVP